jgi:hypothetical protein
MKNYRVIKDNFLGYEAQVRYVWFPFIWFQMNEFFWINTWPSSEHAIHFIQQKKSGKYKPALHHSQDNSSSEYEKEVKLLEFHPKNLKPEVVWNDTESARIFNTSNRRRWWPSVLNPVNG